MSPPRGNGERIAYYRAHVQPWTTNAAEIGLAAADVMAFESVVSSAETLYAQAIAAREASKAATERLQNVLKSMDRSGGDLVKTIRAYAELNDDADAYALAEIPAPRQPAPRPGPGEPYLIEAAISSAGVVALTWKSDNPSGAVGTTYQVSRSIGGAAFEPVGLATKKRFVDTTLAAAQGPVSYQIVAMRSGLASTPARFTLSLGLPTPTASGATIRVAA